jgi:hypothetical protein
VDLRHQAGNEDLVVGRRGPDYQLGHARHGSVHLCDQQQDVAWWAAEQLLEVAPDRSTLGYPVASGIKRYMPLGVGDAQQYERGHVIAPRSPDSDLHPPSLPARVRCPRGASRQAAQPLSLYQFQLG